MYRDHGGFEMTVKLAYLMGGLIVIGAGVASAQPQLQSTPQVLGFEQGSGPNGFPTGWGGGGEGYEMKLDTQAPHGGKACGRIQHRGTAANGFATFTTAAPVEKFLGKRVRYTGWLKSKEVKSAYAGMWMGVDG